jgi:hypothetical protein
VIIGVKENKWLKRISEAKKQIDSVRNQSETGSLVPWAYGPRPLFLAEYLKRLRANDGDDVLIGKVLKALQSEVMRRPEWAGDERVKEQLKGEGHAG